MQFIATLEVDDVDHRFTSTDRPAFFKSRGMRPTPFRPVGDGKSDALLVEAPDIEALQSALATPEAADSGRALTSLSPQEPTERTARADDASGEPLDGAAGPRHALPVELAPGLAGKVVVEDPVDVAHELLVAGAAPASPSHDDS